MPASQVLALGQSPLQPDQYRSSIKSLFYCIRPILTITQPSNYHYEYTTTTQLETALCNQYCFCNTELRTATVTKIKRTFNSDTTEHVCIIYIIKLTLDERKTLTKNSRNLSQQFPHTSACFGHGKIIITDNNKAFCTIGNWHLANALNDPLSTSSQTNPNHLTGNTC